MITSPAPKLRAKLLSIVQLMQTARDSYDTVSNEQSNQQSNPINNQSKDVMSQLLALEYHRERNIKNQDDDDDDDDERDVLTRAPPDD